MTPRQIEREFEKLGKELERNLTHAVRETAREGLAIARQSSYGRWNRKRRQLAGYSYSRRNPHPPPQPLGVINRETGVFLAAWKVTPAQREGGGAIAATVINDSDRVRDLVDASGKPWLSRPIDKLVADRLRPVFQFNVEKALLKTLRR